MPDDFGGFFGWLPGVFGGKFVAVFAEPIFVHFVALSVVDNGPRLVRDAFLLVQVVEAVYDTIVAHLELLAFEWRFGELDCVISEIAHVIEDTGAGVVLFPASSAFDLLRAAAALLGNLLGHLLHVGEEARLLESVTYATDDANT